MTKKDKNKTFVIIGLVILGLFIWKTIAYGAENNFVDVTFYDKDGNEIYTGGLALVEGVPEAVYYLSFCVNMENTGDLPLDEIQIYNARPTEFDTAIYKEDLVAYLLAPNDLEPGQSVSICTTGKAVTPTTTYPDTACTVDSDCFGTGNDCVGGKCLMPIAETLQIGTVNFEALVQARFTCPDLPGMVCESTDGKVGRGQTGWIATDGLISLTINPDPSAVAGFEVSVNYGTDAGGGTIIDDGNGGCLESLTECDTNLQCCSGICGIDAVAPQVYSGYTTGGEISIACRSSWLNEYNINANHVIGSQTVGPDTDLNVMPTWCMLCLEDTVNYFDDINCHPGATVTVNEGEIATYDPTGAKYYRVIVGVSQNKCQ